MRTPSLSATLLTNVATSTLAGVVLLAIPALVGDFMGEVPSWLCRLVGAGLLLFAGWVYWVRRTLPGSWHGVGWVLGFDVAWVLATPVAMLVFDSHLSIWGHLVLVDVALLVAAFAFLEAYWLKHLKHRGAQSLSPTEL